MKEKTKKALLVGGIIAAATGILLTVAALVYKNSKGQRTEPEEVRDLQEQIQDLLKRIRELEVENKFLRNELEKFAKKLSAALYRLGKMVAEKEIAVMRE